MTSGAKEISPKNKSKQKCAAFLNTNSHTPLSVCAFATRWKQLFRNVPQKAGTPKRFGNVLTKFLKNNCKRDIFSGKTQVVGLQLY